LKTGNMYYGVKPYNPFVGCLNGCIYCKPSFVRQVRRVYYCQGRKCRKCFDFVPHEHPERLLLPVPTGKVIWPCAHGDIAFADPSFIRQIIIKTQRYPDKTFYWQSKNPLRFAQYLNDFPKSNTILLTTLETNRDEGYGKISKAPLPSIRYNDFKNLNWDRKVLTIEPILEFDHDIFLSWIKDVNPEAIWIGYNSKPKSVQLPEPPKENTLAFIKAIYNYGYEVRIKTMR